VSAVATVNPFAKRPRDPQKVRASSSNEEPKNLRPPRNNAHSTNIIIKWILAIMIIAMITITAMIIAVAIIAMAIIAMAIIAMAMDAGS